MDEEAAKVIKVLIIDDEERLLRALRLGLKNNGFDVFTAQTAEEGLELLLSRSFDVALTDIRLKGMSGLDLIYEMERLQIKVPAIVMTAFADVTSAVKALKHGACDYIQKPFSIDEIKKAIHEILTQHPTGDNIAPESLNEGISQTEKEMILRALQRSGHVKAKAAKLLKISERSLWYKLKKYNIS